MDLRKVAIATGGFLALVGGFLVFVIVFGSDDGGASTPPSVVGAAPARQPANKQLEQQVLQGYEVKFWGEGRPFVSYYDPGAGDYATHPIDQALFWQSQYAGGDVVDMGGAPATQGGAEAAYRLGLVHEHGLFGCRVDRAEALRYYRIARMAGHKPGDAAASRLETQDT